MDGGRPDVRRAEKYGLRYVHLPLGYDGIPRDRALEISRAINELPGKLYVHCHHGKHRSPAAVAGALVCSQGWSGDRATEFLKQAGTSPGYTGLYETVYEMKRATTDELAKADSSFPSVAKVPTFVDMMVHVEEHFDALTKSRAAKWQAPADSPDIVPASAALQIMELFRESVRTGQTTHSEPNLTAWLEQAESSAATLEKALQGNDLAEAEAAYKQLSQSCAACHGKYRNPRRTK